MKVKLKQLKAMDTDPTYVGKSRYQAIPHYDVLRALAKATGGLDSTCTFDTQVENEDRIMTSIVRNDPDGKDVRAVVVIASSHDGRQAVEAFFGHEILVGGESYIGLITSATTIRQSHTVNADLHKWAEDVVERFEFARTHTRPISSWWKTRKTTEITEDRAKEVLGEWVGNVPPRPFRSMMPLPKRGGVDRVLSLMKWDDFKLGRTEAGLLAATIRVIGESKSGIAAVYRQNGLFLKLGDLTPPEVFVN